MNTIMIHNTTLDNATAAVDSSLDITMLGGAFLADDRNMMIFNRQNSFKARPTINIMKNAVCIILSFIHKIMLKKKTVLLKSAELNPLSGKNRSRIQIVCLQTSCWNKLNS